MAACDDDDDDPVAPNPPPTDTADTVSATLTSLNGSTAGGTATFILEGDVLTASVNVTGADTGTVIRQFVMTGGACPSTAADTNADSFIDGLEALAVTGNVLIPLDADLSTQDAGAGTFPTADASGAYTYGDTVSFTSFMDDLTATDPDPGDLVDKLTSDTLNLDTRAILLLGVADSVVLDSTVLALPGLTANQSFPIACGAID
jgi:hypothetical protein